MRYLRIPANRPQSPASPPLILIHGLLGYSFSWRHNLDAFSQHRDVYVVDLLGIGHSDRPPRGSVDLSMAATAERLYSWIRTLGLQQVDVVGTSHGGALAMMLAARDRRTGGDVVRSLILVAPANPFMPNAKIRIALFGSPLGRWILGRYAAASTTIRERSMGAMYADESLITEDTRVGYNVNLDDPTSYHYALEIVRTWKPDMRSLQDALPLLAPIPALLVWGDRDGAVDVRSAHKLQRCFHHARLEILHNVGHMPYEEAPERFNRVVLQFLQELR